MIKPLHDNVVLKKKEVEKKTASGIILSGSATEKQGNIAEVVAIGPKNKADLNIGDKVVYKEYSGTDVTLDAEDFIIIEAEDILAVIA